MEHRTWTTIEKAAWGDGPWQTEPDKEQFTDEATGLPCLVKRSLHSGALCGYVGVPPGHPWHGRDYDEIDPSPGLCQDGPEDSTICHIPAPGEPDGVWWLGFDCAHAFDVSPAMAARERELGLPHLLHLPGPQEQYRHVGYVKTECARLAEQAAAIPAGSPTTRPR